MKTKWIKKVMLCLAIFWISGVTSITTVFAEDTTITMEEVETARESIKETFTAEALKTPEVITDGAPSQQPKELEAPEEVAESQVSGQVWLDSNEDGKQDPEETGIENYPVYLFKETDRDNSVAQARTDASGNYFFEKLTEGTYLVGIRSEILNQQEYLPPMVDDQEDNLFIWDQVGTYAYTEAITLDGINKVDSQLAGVRQAPMIQPLGGTVKGTSVTVDMDTTLSLQQEIAALGIAPNRIAELAITSSTGQVLMNTDIAYIIANLTNLETLDMSAITYYQNTMLASLYTGDLTSLGRLKKFSIPKGLVSMNSSTSVNNAVFYNSWTLETVDFSGSADTLEYIGPYVFYAVQTLENINLNVCTKLEYIGDYTFGGAQSRPAASIEKLSKDNLPLSLKSIGSYTFRNNTKLETVDLSNFLNLEEVASINNSSLTFQLCTELKYVNFSGCINLKHVGNYAFQLARKLEKVDLSHCISMTQIGNSAFDFCDKLEKADLFNCVSLITIDGFDSCASLTEIDLSACTNLTNIGFNAFRRCVALKDIYMVGITNFVTLNKTTASTPIASMSNFENVENARVHVAPSMVASYQADPSWNMFLTTGKWVSVSGSPVGSGPNVSLQPDYLIMEEFRERGTDDTLGLPNRQVVPMGDDYIKTAIPAQSGWLGVGYRVDSLGASLETTLPINFTPVNDVTTFYYTYGAAQTITEKYIDEIGSSIGTPDTTEIVLKGDTYQKNIPAVSGWRIIGYRMGSPGGTLQTGTSVSFVANTDETVYFVYSNSSILENELTVNQKKVPTGTTVDWRLELSNLELIAANNIYVTAAFPTGKLSLVTTTIQLERFNGGVSLGQTAGTTGDLDGTNNLNSLAQDETLVITFQTVTTGNPDEVLELPVTLNWDDASPIPKTATLVDTLRVTDDAQEYPATTNDIEFVSVPKAYQFGTQDMDSMPQTVGLPSNLYQNNTNAMTQGFYVRIRDDRTASTGWHLSVGLSDLVDNHNNLMPNGMGSMVEMDNLSVENILNPEMTNESVNPTPVNMPALTNTKINLTSGAAATRVMSAAVGDGQGTWQLRIPFNQLKLTLPGNAGKSGAAYKANLTWTLNDTP